MGEMAVREARPDEYDALAALTVAAYSEYADKFSAAWWRYYRRDLGRVAERAGEGVVLVAEEAGELLGTVTYMPPSGGEPASDAGHVVPPGWAWFRSLAVRPDRRGRGVGKRLVEACIERARADGAAALGLMTTFVMPVARAMYERMGFELVEEHQDWSEGLYWTYALPLAPASP